MRWLVRRLRMWNRRTRLWILATIALLSFVALILAPPIPLWLGYHEFSDRRVIFGIRRGLDVLSNLPFVLVGIWSLAFLVRNPNRAAFNAGRERIPYFVFFFGVTLTGFGSAYYHLTPGNSRLIWDLLPMTLSFVSIVDAAIVERISVKLGLWLLPALLLLGAASVGYWYLGELQARGDLRFYLFVQCFPALAIALIILLFRPRYTGDAYLLVAFTFYVFAKALELFDGPIFAQGRVVSGHTLKHLTASLACYWILRMLQCRSVIPDDSAVHARSQQRPWIRMRNSSAPADSSKADGADRGSAGASSEMRCLEAVHNFARTPADRPLPRRRYFR